MESGLDARGTHATVAIDKLDRRHLFKVMIFGGHPKHRHRFYAAQSKTLRELDRRQRLVNRVERTSEQSGLLA